MLVSQRALFDIPRDVCFLNAASWSPLPLAAQEAGRTGAARKGRPWLIDQDFATSQYERARHAAAQLINAQASDVALIPSVSYGLATAAKVLTVPAGSRVLTLADDHSSPVLEWTTRAGPQGFTVETLQRPSNGDWTEALIVAIARPGAARVALASVSSVHWSDGGMLDLGKVAGVLRSCGAALLIDATQSAGVLPLDVCALDPDFVVFPTYKWLVGPYGRAFLYVARRHQDGIPLEQTSYGRRDVRADATTYFADTRYVDGARRFDMGERDHFISLEMASIGMETMTQWGNAAVVARLGALTQRIVDGLRDIDVGVPDGHVRAPHILSLTFPQGPANPLVERLAAQGIYVAPRLGRMRISPHVYNDEEDVDRFVAALRELLAPGARRVSPERSTTFKRSCGRDA
ncbi:MAG: aminotransferase class V-fold PLP-dependent enzyme [Hyphomicrobiaceae bacterium]|nr:aminotransferase class V-fold PLP-dependent enzyme [Hyphomicrobiaceae bacterium]